MENIKIFLKLLNKVGYPNKDIISISQMAGYNLEYFLPDLINEIGEDKTNWFVSEAFSKLSTKDGIRLNLAGGINSFGTTVGPIIVSYFLFGSLTSELSPSPSNINTSFSMIRENDIMYTPFIEKKM